MQEIQVSTYLTDRVNRAESSTEKTNSFTIFSSILLIISVLFPLALIITIPLFIISFIYSHSKKEDSNAFVYGIQGENILKQTLKKELSSSYTAFYNFPVKNSGDIDCILVGPKGIFTIEVKHHKGVIRNENGKWFQTKESFSGYTYTNAISNPEFQITRNTKRLTRFLQSHGINVQVIPVVVFTNSEVKLDVKENFSYTQICYIEKLPELIRNSKTMLSADDISKIKNLLSQYQEIPSALPYNQTKPKKNIKILRKI